MEQVKLTAREYAEKMDALIESAKTATVKERAEILAKMCELQSVGYTVGGSGRKERTIDELEFCLLSQFGDSSKENKVFLRDAIRAFYAGENRTVLVALLATEYTGYARAVVNEKTVHSLFDDLAKAYGVTDLTWSKVATVGARFHVETAEVETETETEAVTEVA